MTTTLDEPEAPVTVEADDADAMAALGYASGEEISQ